MKTPRLSWLIAASGALLGALTIALLPEQSLFIEPAHTDTADATTGERWACAMMDFIGTKPGACPVCGMTLQRVVAGELNREQQRRMGLQLSRVVEGPARATVRAYGAVRYDERTLQVLIPRVGGRVVRRYDAALHPGTLVQVGDPVVDLYSAEAFAAQGELAAAVALGEEPTIRAIVERFERWNLRAVADAIVRGKEPTDTIQIVSPFAGRVVDQLSAEDTEPLPLPRVGQEIAADAPLLRLVDPDSFMVVIHVPEARAHWMRVGQPVRIASDDLGELPEISAQVAWVAPELDLEIRSREVHVHLNDPKARMLPGSLVSARFEVTLAADLSAAAPDAEGAPAQFVLVPKTAVLSTGVRNVVWRAAERQRDGRVRFELAPVALGPRLEDEHGNDQYVVRHGLAAGDEVATQGAFLIDSQAQLAGTASLLFPTGAPAAGSGHQH